MAFSSFQSLSEALPALQIKEKSESFIELQPVEVCDYFQEELATSLRDFDVDCSEWAVCENLIYPVVRQALKPFADVLGVWSHIPLFHADRMMGIPDYIIAKKSALSKKVMGPPFALIIEAKKNDFDWGWAQCLAAMHAVQTLNQDPNRVIYGVVSDGFIWWFGKLRGLEFSRHPQPYDLSRLDELFGALQHLLMLCKEQVLRPATAA